MYNLIKIKAYEVGLAFKNGKLMEVLSEGTHWYKWGYKVDLYDLTKPFNPPTNLDILLKNNTLNNMIDLVEVGDNEIVLKYVKNVLTGILPTGQYAYWKNVLDYTFVKVDVSSVNPPNINPTMLENKLLINYLRKFNVDNNQKGVLYIDNKFVKILDAGTYYFWRNATVISMSLVDIRLQQTEISGQELLTKDKANIRINFYIRHMVVDIVKAIINTKEAEKQLYMLIQLAIREHICLFTLDELLAKKEVLGKEITDFAKEKVSQFGIELVDGGIRDIILPGDMREIMNQVLIAEKKAQANIIMRREETASTRSLLNTANLMKDNEMLWKLKEMEYVEKIAERIGEISISGSGNIVGQLKEIFTK